MPRKSVVSTENIGRGKELMRRNVWLALLKADCYFNNNIIYIRPILCCKQTASLNVAMFRSHRRRWYLISLQLHHQVATPSPTVNQERVLLAEYGFQAANVRNRYELLKNSGIFYNWKAHVDLVIETELRLSNRFWFFCWDLPSCFLPISRDH